jgi:hypothetical protein
MPYGRYQPTPAQIISWLPKDATPEQQDSAVQAHIKPQEIHWSERPDTLHLPGQPIGKSVTEVNIPIYYKENFFSEKPYYHPEIIGGRQGIAGDPVPYTVASDNFMTSVMIICLIGTATAISASSGFFLRRIKDFFRPEHSHNSDFTETSNEIRIQLFLAVETCLLLAILFIFYLKSYVADTFTTGQHQMIGIFTGAFASFFIIKALLQALIGWVFFDKKKNRQWMNYTLFLVSGLGLLLLPAALVQSFFNLNEQISLIYLLSAVILYYLMSFYKQYHIFFIQKRIITGFILYLCALELIPLSSMWTVLMTISEYLKINF